MKSIELPTGPHDRPPGNHLHLPGNKPHPHPELLEASSASPRRSYQALEDTIKHQQQHTRKDLYTESKEQRVHSHFRGKMLTLAHGHNPKSQVAFGRHLPCHASSCKTGAGSWDPHLSKPWPAGPKPTRGRHSHDQIQEAGPPRRYGYWRRGKSV